MEVGRQDCLSGSLQTGASEEQQQQQHRSGEADRRGSTESLDDAARQQDLFVWKDVGLVALTQIVCWTEPRGASTPSRSDNFLHTGE